VGPTIAEQEVAVGKLIALFDRAEARDFVDVFEFCQRYEPALLLELAVRRDAGLGPQDLAERVRRLTEQLTEADLPAAYQDRFEEIRGSYADWRTILLGRPRRQRRDSKTRPSRRRPNRRVDGPV